MKPCFGYIIRKINKFFLLVFTNMFMLIFKDHLPYSQRFLHRVCEISLKWFLLAFLLNERCKHKSSLIKQKPCHRASSSHWSRNLRMPPKSYFQFLPEVVNKRHLRRGAAYKILRFTSYLWQQLHIQMFTIRSYVVYFVITTKKVQ